MNIMVNTFELDNIISEIMPCKSVAQMHKSAVIGGISQEYFIYISSEQKEGMKKDLIHTKEHFGKMFYFYLMDREKM